MKYITLLRGINVGGNNKVGMSELRQALQAAGFRDVTTYINSGNVLLTSELPVNAVNAVVEEVIRQTFGLNVPALTITSVDFLGIAGELPQSWTNDTEMKSDCLFLWQGIDTPQVLENMTIKSDIDRVTYVPGAVFWSVDRKNSTRSGLAGIVGTAAYKQVTIRNVNTVRKLAALLE